MNESIFYKITKKRRFHNSDEFEVVQNIFIPNTSELDIVKFVDTQLKYSKYATYKYDVYAQRVVFGSKYRYLWEDNTFVTAATEDTLNDLGFPLEGQQPPEMPVDPSTPVPAGSMVPGMTENEFLHGLSVNKVSDNADLGAAVTVKVYPSIKVIDDLIFSTPEIFIMDKPPVPPHVNIVPFRAVNNKVKILLSGLSDRFRAVPVIMMDSDIEEFDKIKKAQLVVDGSGSPLEDGKVEFGSDDIVRRFQIFRTLTRPKKYSDFGHVYMHATAGHVIDDVILPNTKYYYTFRAIDDHDHVSNPTAVYEVELIDKYGAVKPIIRTISMEPASDKVNVKESQKYIYIKPVQKQIYFSENAEVDSIFSSQTKKKRYKMRLTSKGSGKKIDVNFSFRKKIKL